MHAELMEIEMSRDELNVWGVVGAMRRGFSKQDACKRYGFTESEFDKRLEYYRRNEQSSHEKGNL